MKDAAPIVLLALGAVIGVVGGWISRPQSMTAQRAVWAFVALLVIAAVVTYGVARMPDRDAAAPPGAPPDGATGGPPASGGGSTGARSPAASSPTAAPTAGSSAKPVRSAGVPTPGTAETTKATSPYVAAERFQRFGGTHGAFTFATAGSRMTITTPDSGESQWGGVLNDHVDCDATVEFDLRLSTGTVDYYGLAVLIRGEVADDQPNGGGILFYRDSDGTFIAKYSGFPSPGVGGMGGGSYPVANLNQTRHLVVRLSGTTHTVTVDGTPAGDYAELDSAGCGKLVIAAWGGVTATVDHILIR